MSILYIAASGLALAWSAQIALIGAAGCYLAVTGTLRKPAV
jgi:hypothetical protein